MKTTISYLSIFSILFFLASCGGGETAESSAEENTMEDSDANNSDKAELTGDYVLNTDESLLMWEGNMLKVGGVSLYGHNGTMKFLKGMINFENGSIKGGTLVVDMTSITPTDENYDPEEDRTKAKLIGHLSSDDFFAVKEHPVANYELKGGDMSGVKGLMTIRGITKSESIRDLKMIDNGDQVTIKGMMTIDRQKYNVAFEMPAEDKVLSDDLDLEFKVVLEKQKTS